MKQVIPANKSIIFFDDMEEIKNFSSDNIAQFGQGLLDKAKVMMNGYASADDVPKFMYINSNNNTWYSTDSFDIGDLVRVGGTNSGFGIVESASLSIINMVVYNKKGVYLYYLNPKNNTVARIDTHLEFDKIPSSEFVNELAEGVASTSIRWELTVDTDGLVQDGDEEYGKRLYDNTFGARCGDIIFLSVQDGTMFTRYVGVITSKQGASYLIVAQRFMNDNQADDTGERFRIDIVFGGQPNHAVVGITKMSSGLNNVFLTEAQYNALSSKDSNTLYYIIEQ